MRSYFLYVEFISYPTCGKWSLTPLWCRLAGWGRIVSVSFPRTSWSLLFFSHFYFGVLSSGALIWIVGILFMSLSYVWGTLSSFKDVFIMRYDIWLYVDETYFPSWLDIIGLSFDLCWMKEVFHLEVFELNVLFYILK